MESTILETISTFLSAWLPLVLQIVGAAALIATMTPNKVDDKIIQSIMDIVNFLAANFGKAKNDADV